MGGAQAGAINNNDARGFVGLGGVVQEVARFDASGLSIKPGKLALLWAGENNFLATVSSLPDPPLSAAGAQAISQNLTTIQALKERGAEKILTISVMNLGKIPFFNGSVPLVGNFSYLYDPATSAYNDQYAAAIRHLNHHSSKKSQVFFIDMYALTNELIERLGSEGVNTFNSGYGLGSSPILPPLPVRSIRSTKDLALSRQKLILLLKSQRYIDKVWEIN